MTNQHTNILTNSNINVWRHCIAYQQNEEKRRHCNANWKPTREETADLWPDYDIITDVVITVMMS